MSRRIVVVAEAGLELEEAPLWYEAPQSGLGVEFLAAVDGVISMVGNGFDGTSRVDRTRRLHTTATIA